MGKVPQGEPAPAAWNPEGKEPWHLDFEREPVNDEQWTCLVTAAIPAEAYDEEYVQIFTQCADTRLRKAIAVVTMTDVIKLLKRNRRSVEIKRKEPKPEPPGLKGSSPKTPEIVALAAAHATFTDVECRLPPDLMVAVLKHLILELKKEHCLRKRLEVTKARMRREAEIRAKFVRDIKPFQVRWDEEEQETGSSQSALDLQDPIDDEPPDGPDLYVMLVDFYDVSYFPQLLRVNVPFVALLKISREPGKLSHTSMLAKVEAFAKIEVLVAEFWRNLKETLDHPAKAAEFKDVAMIQYVAPTMKNAQTMKLYETVFGELSQMQYAAYRIYRRHQQYLQELHVQRVVLSLEPLDLSKCDIYNKLCDALVSGEPITPCLVLYAMIEQVVAGVPATESTSPDYEPRFSDFFPSGEKKESVDSFPEKSSPAYSAVIPCEECRLKRWHPCEQKRLTPDESLLERRVSLSPSPTASQAPEPSLPSLPGHSYSTNPLEKTAGTSTPTEDYTPGSKSWSNEITVTELDSSEKSRGDPHEFRYSESFIAGVLSEKKTEKELRRDRKWKTPSLVSHGDSVTLQTFHCDPRLLDPQSIASRFLKSSKLSLVWRKYPELSAVERAFYNYHFFSLWRTSEEPEELLKLKVFFTLSMKIIGIIKSYLYKGDEENHSEMNLGKDKIKKMSKVRTIPQTEFSYCFFSTFVMDTYLKVQRTKVFEANKGPPGESTNLANSTNLPQKVESRQDILVVNHPNSGICFFQCFKTYDNIISKASAVGVQGNKEIAALLSILDCLEISSLTEPLFLQDKVSYANLIQGFNFFEELEPYVMVQRLLEADAHYNTILCSYFAPTDTLIIVMHNDFDHRGIFCGDSLGTLPTPVTLRDFYNYVCPEISDWIAEEDEKQLKYVAEFEEQAKEAKEKREAEYLLELKRYFCHLNEEGKRQFLEENDEEETELQEEDLDPLPPKPKTPGSNKISFVATNFSPDRVEVRNSVKEYHSRDGTQVSVVGCTWLHDPPDFFSVSVKRSSLKLCYHTLTQGDDPEVATGFTFKTASDIIFVFFKEDPEPVDGFNYHVRISWPVGLLVDGVPDGSSGMYVRQGYLKAYRRGWEIEEEKSRCHLRNGHVLVFKDSGDVDILTANGTLYALYEFGRPDAKTSGAVPILFSRYEITTPCGEVWEVGRSPCKRKKKLTNKYKVYIGADPKTQEIFYRRDDGVQSMLWPSGKLVIKYPDGTKITSVPDFDDEEVHVEWSEEEKLYFFKLEEMTGQLEQPKSRTILRNPSSVRSFPSRKLLETFEEGFVSVSCSVLMEHPKYSTVFFGAREPFVEVKMPEMLSIKMYAEGNYEVAQDRHVLKVFDTTAQFSTDCRTCNKKSIASLYLDSGDTLCTLSDLFQKEFSVERDGETTFKDLTQEWDEEVESTGTACDHGEDVAGQQRCFAFERDQSGVEFFHVEALARYCHNLPADTYFELNYICKDSTLSHTFSSPHYKVGYETWTMDYEDKADSLPTNLKRKDLKEMGVKENRNKFYKQLFPNQNNQPQGKPERRKVDMPKVVVTRTVKGFSQQPKSVIEGLQGYVAEYQKRVRDICEAYVDHKPVDDSCKDARYVKMRLKKIALTLSQSLNMYPHLCTQFPSTEKDIHYFGHFINAMDVFRNHFENETDYLPDCKHIPRPLPRLSDFPSIIEEAESPR